jgi:hypothetical protein
MSCLPTCNELPAHLPAPPGTRNIGKDSLPLRRGMLYYAHSRKLPVQVSTAWTPLHR